MMKISIVGLIALGIFLIAKGEGAVDQCDWYGSENEPTAQPSVQSVHLRCTKGTIQWRYPHDALMVYLSLPSSFSSDDNRSFLTCLKPYGPVRVFLPNRNNNTSLIPLFLPSIKKKPLYRCFHFGKNYTSLYMEAENKNYSEIIEVQYNLELKSLKGSSTLRTLEEEEECRPCSRDELIITYCDSSLVAKATIIAVEHQPDDPKTDEVTFKIDLIMRSPPKEEDSEASNKSLSKSNGSNIRVKVPSTCDVQQGQGKYVIMLKQRFEDFVLVCAPRLEEWAQIIREIYNSPCILLPPYLT